MRVVIGKYPGSRSKKPRRIDVRIDDWDLWNLDHTLALIILPALKRLRDTKMGSPYVDDEDVPPEMRLNEEPCEKNNWEGTPNVHERWEFVLDEMITAFGFIVDDSWEEQYYGPPMDMVGWCWHEETIARGVRLFGRYYRGLWD